MKLMLNCKEAHRLTSEGFDRHLSLGERTRLRTHTMLCAGCRNFTAQMQLIRQAMRGLGRDGQSARDDDLP